ncbi:hypothetical protein KQX54_013778 [Cotesia glomerata]|uniref:Phorbol-ester/DAG-type domain-containing protein n=1 Tax=Cotesia glomerata TaxID=32391 RepID=A0AAV7HX37_COTGL|nr:hypothetical protein KQX54_013778 [Cotesia glomerata]
MSVSAETCYRCKAVVKTAFTCENCVKSFHQSCARDYIKGRPPTDCCRTQFAYLLKILDLKTQNSNNLLNSLRSVKSQNSSTSSFKSAKSSSNSSNKLTNEKLQSGYPSSITPTFLLSPSRDTIFSPATMSTATTKSQDTLPEGWSTMSNSEMLTVVMRSLSSQKVVLAQIPSLNSSLKTIFAKIDNLGKRIDSLQNEQTKAKEKLADLSSSIITNSQKINDVNLELEALKTESTEMAKTLAGVLQSKTSTSSSSSELVISGIPESVSQDQH